ncbi:MAG: hypothetical protein KA059_08210 [Elusimicrobiales bacterium]|nr:hypothetical protein [Elusimicrobiales bacterium]NLH38519.1 hypothetical protein [Elusimicrobiota bacterium]
MKRLLLIAFFAVTLDAKENSVCVFDGENEIINYPCSWKVYKFSDQPGYSETTEAGMEFYYNRYPASNESDKADKNWAIIRIRKLACDDGVVCLREGEPLTLSDFVHFFRCDVPKCLDKYPASMNIDIKTEIGDVKNCKNVSPDSPGLAEGKCGNYQYVRKYGGQKYYYFTRTAQNDYFTGINVDVITVFFSRGKNVFQSSLTCYEGMCDYYKKNFEYVIHNLKMKK